MRAMKLWCSGCWTSVSAGQFGCCSHLTQAVSTCSGLGCCLAVALPRSGHRGYTGASAGLVWKVIIGPAQRGPMAEAILDAQADQPWP